MAIVINGTGTVTGISVGGLPDGIVDTDMLAATAVTGAKIGALPGGLWKADGTGMTISSGSETKLDMFNTAKWTNGSMSWDDTNKRIAFPIAGVYAVYIKLTAADEQRFGLGPEYHAQQDKLKSVLNEIQKLSEINKEYAAFQKLDEKQNENLAMISGTIVYDLIEYGYATEDQIRALLGE